MPTDGTLLLEHVPKHKQYLVTALSVFFSLGSVLSAIVGIIIIPAHSCSSRTDECDVETSNLGWKYMLGAIGLIVSFIKHRSNSKTDYILQTLSFFLARILFFRLHESPRYLVHAGRHEEARLNLQKISRFNGSELSLDINDVIDHHSDIEEHAPSIPKPIERPRTDVRVIFDANHPSGVDTSETEPLTSDSNASSKASNHDSPERLNYDSTGSSDAPLDSHNFLTPTSEIPPSLENVADPDDGNEDEESKSQPLLDRPSLSRHSRRSSLHEAKAKIYWALPRRMRRPLWAWLDRLAMVLTPEWRRTTILVCLVWCFLALGE